ncbi:YfbM family protein [Actinopolymorpha sp. B11F2]|uniref:YfbM family protein n=1 Tax=Actinopolymorpha sp. B11F2 TaxID=3160862 RepID=UPI0032E392C4
MGMIWVGYRRNSSAARQLLEDPDLLEDLLESDDGDTSVDLDKAWHGVHWLLTGAEGPIAGIPSEAIFGGEPVGEDLGYGPGRLLPASRVSGVAAELHELDVDTLRSRMDPAAMTRAGIYPSIWDEEDVFDAYLAPAYESLRGFYTAAARAGESVIQTIC